MQSTDSNSRRGFLHHIWTREHVSLHRCLYWLVRIHIGPYININVHLQQWNAAGVDALADSCTMGSSSPSASQLTVKLRMAVFMMRSSKSLFCVNILYGCYLTTLDIGYYYCTKSDFHIDSLLKKVFKERSVVTRGTNNYDTKRDGARKGPDSSLCWANGRSHDVCVREKHLSCTVASGGVNRNQLLTVTVIQPHALLHTVLVT